MPGRPRAGALEEGNERQSRGLPRPRHLDSDGSPCDLLCTHVPVEMPEIPAGAQRRDCGPSPVRAARRIMTNWASGPVPRKL